MTLPRATQVCLESTTYYHCVSRCVRQSYLCGFDRMTKRDYEHRREWVESLILRLSEAFCIDVAGYAVMSNHYHVILHVNADQALALTVHEIAERWGQLYSLNELVSSYLDGGELSESERLQVEVQIESWRDNLFNISKFMGYLNEKIARQANEEDKCKGRFWEGRFKCQALLDETAVIQCMAYVDLNPVRAKMAKTPEKSEFTSIYKRLTEPDNNLMPFAQQKRPLDDLDSQLPIEQTDYLNLLDWTGRVVRLDKRGAIPEDYPPILDRLGKTPKDWMKEMTPNPDFFEKAKGSIEAIQAYCQALGKRWLWRRATETA